MGLRGAANDIDCTLSTYIGIVASTGHTTVCAVGAVGTIERVGGGGRWFEDKQRKHHSHPHRGADMSWRAALTLVAVSVAHTRAQLQVCAMSFLHDHSGVDISWRGLALRFCLFELVNL